jgi:hypothetical protein
VNGENNNIPTSLKIGRNKIFLRKEKPVKGGFGM